MGQKGLGGGLEAIIYADGQMELGSSPTLFPKAGETLTRGPVNFSSRKPEISGQDMSHEP